MEPMDLVKQTGTTIIFEEFNAEYDDLVTLLTRDSEMVSLEKFKNELIGKNAALAVESFEQFVERFSPTIYETIVQAEDGCPRFVYELEKPRYDCPTISLKDHAFYRMIMNLLSRKANTDKGNLEFPYDDLKKALTPEAEMEDLKRLRKNLISNTMEWMRLTENGEPSAEADRFANNISDCLNKVVRKYGGNVLPDGMGSPGEQTQRSFPLTLLPLLIADKQAQIDRIQIAKEAAGGGEQEAAPCVLVLDNQGNLSPQRLIDQSYSDDASSGPKLLNEGSANIIAAIQDDFQEHAPPALQGNNYVRDLIVSVFAPDGMAQLATQDEAALQAAKKQYQDVYKSSLESFAKAVSAVVEKFAGMREFFDHAACNGSLAKNVSVIIANCKVDAILSDAVAKERFRAYFGGLSREKDVNRIWFGVIPAVDSGEGAPAATARRASQNPFDRRMKRDTAAQKTRSGLVGAETAKEMLRLLDEVKIMTFFNYKASESTGFVELTKKRIQGYMDDFSGLNSEYAVFAYPNFTILPEEKRTVKIGTEFDVSERKTVGTYITIPGIYLDAAYVAAGMMVGIQNYELLKSLGYKVTPHYPCVRFDLEAGDNAKRVLTRLNRETTTEMSSDTKDAILQERFGFAFADNKIVYNGNLLKNSYVLNARSLKKEGGKYKSIYKTLVRNFVDQLLRFSNDSVTESSVNAFLSEYAETWKNDSRDAERMYANRILMEGETIKLDPEKHRLVVRFNKQEEVWDDIVIDDANAEREE